MTRQVNATKADMALVGLCLVYMFGVIKWLTTQLLNELDLNLKN